MRQKTIKEFHQNMWNEIKDLPVEVTRNNIPIFRCEPVTVGDLKRKDVPAKKVDESQIPVTVERKLGYCNYPYCKKPAVKERDGRFWCEDHL